MYPALSSFKSHGLKWNSCLSPSWLLELQSLADQREGAGECCPASAPLPAALQSNRDVWFVWVF